MRRGLRIYYEVTVRSWPPVWYVHKDKRWVELLDPWFIKYKTSEHRKFFTARSANREFNKLADLGFNVVLTKHTYRKGRWKCTAWSVKRNYLDKMRKKKSYK